MGRSFKDYYLQNAEAINERRRKRYREEKSLRDNARRRASEAWSEADPVRVAVRQREIADAVKQVGDVPSDRRHCRYVRLRGRVGVLAGTKVYSVLAVSKVLGVSTDTLRRRWIPAGALPPHSWKDGVGGRWWTHDRVTFARRVVLDHRAKHVSVDDFARVVRREWRKRRG